jgi:tRNA(Ile)-lysidine synthase
MSVCKVMADLPTPRPTPADFPPLDDLARALNVRSCSTSSSSVPLNSLATGQDVDVAPFAIALSGGADSTALLIACALRWPQKVHAIHINHGLQEAASAFESLSVNVCKQWQVPLVIRHVQARHQLGESPEDAARVARYRALADVAQTQWLDQAGQPTVGHIVLAQHADDQVETLLLALSRGAGLPGLASMPSRMTRFGVEFHRPWLSVSGETLRETLKRFDTHWEEDPTNSDTRYTRNRIRHKVLPALAQTFAGFRQTFARSAVHAAQAQILLQDLAQMDAQEVGIPPKIKALQRLSPERQTNLLRYWLAQEGQQASAAQMQALLVQVAACTTRGHQIDLKIGRGFVRRDGALLRCYNL